MAAIQADIDRTKAETEKLRGEAMEVEAEKGGGIGNMRPRVERDKNAENSRT